VQRKGKYSRKPFDQVKFDKALNDLRERYVTLTDMEAEGKLAMGDACKVNMVGYMANSDGTKGEPLPNAASGDNVEVVLEYGKYMEGLVEGILGAAEGEIRKVNVAFPERLRDKTLAGKKAIFDVTVMESYNRSLPEVDDDFAAIVRPDLTVETLKDEIRKAVDEEDARKFVGARNEALGKALVERTILSVPDTLINQQAKEKYAVTMTEMRENGVDDDILQKTITPENYLKFKKIYAPGIADEFKLSVALEEIAKAENIEVPANHVDEQMEGLKMEAEKEGQEFNEADVRTKVESTLKTKMVYDFLAESAELEINYTDKPDDFDEDLMNKLMDESVEREKKWSEDSQEDSSETPGES